MYAQYAELISEVLGRLSSGYEPDPELDQEIDCLMRHPGGDLTALPPLTAGVTLRTTGSIDDALTAAMVLGRGTLRVESDILYGALNLLSQLGWHREFPLSPQIARYVMIEALNNALSP